MSAIPTTHRPAARPALSRIGPPSWVVDFVGSSPEEIETETLAVIRSDTAALTGVRIENAVDRSPTDLLNAVRDGYATIFKHSVGRVVRCWNFVPGINTPVTTDQTRYMIFNAGRYAAFLDQFGSTENFDWQVPTASGVGTTGDDLFIHAMSVDGPAIHFGNPRQTSPHKYSDRFGKRPPCFARATRVGDRLLVGGTASIRGENSLHNDLASQTAETFLNLKTVLKTGRAGGLESVTDVRVYHPRSADTATIRRSVAREFQNARQIEVVLADLCRPELLIEIEVVAQISTDPSRRLRYSDDPDSRVDGRQSSTRSQG